MNQEVIRDESVPGGEGAWTAGTARWGTPRPSDPVNRSGCHRRQGEPRQAGASGQETKVEARPGRMTQKEPG